MLARSRIQKIAVGGKNQRTALEDISKEQEPNGFRHCAAARIAPLKDSC